MTNLKVDNYQQKLDIPKAEQEVLAFWDETHAFEESVKQRPDDKRYVFYDGPPFATGLPHYGHILTSVVKDVIPRYWTMKGYRVGKSHPQDWPLGEFQKFLQNYGQNVYGVGLVGV